MVEHCRMHFMKIQLKMHQDKFNYMFSVHSLAQYTEKFKNNMFCNQILPRNEARDSKCYNICCNLQ